ncbi:hypothetical protein KJ618_04480 [Patescibacteria group bacterium]|nr:hypothetical protein [Patescibacteria group bacterium]MBU2544693.1 hypothetical protein [Patescibacteria group bacterium]
MHTILKQNKIRYSKTAMLGEGWNIIYYESPSGDVPVYDFIESLNSTAKSKVLNTFDLLTEFGIKLGLPHVKKAIGTDLWS